MRAAAFFIVLATAKAVALAGHSFDVSVWAPFAYLSQDAALAMVFALAERAGRGRPRLLWLVYVVACLYVALTIPVVRVLSTPLTTTMWRAAGGALRDSIWYYATPSNLAAVALLVAVAAIAPLVTRRLAPATVAAALLPFAAIGALNAARVDTRGFERNAWSALALSAFPRAVAATRLPAEASRVPLVDSEVSADLSWLRGLGAGRNVVMVSLESTAAQYLGLYGATPDIAPNLTRLAQSAVVFDRAYAVYPESIKGLFSTLCSRYPAFDRAADVYARARCQSPAAILSERGYRTALFHAGRFAYLGMNAVIRDRGFDVLEDAGDVGGNRESSFGVDELSVVNRMLQWIDRLPARDRFFITYLPIAGHHPYESSATGPFPDRSEFDRYRNAVHDGDAALGRFIDGIRARGLYRDTMWIVYGDHGEAFGQHDGNYGHTFQLYEENVRVPLLIAMPGRLAQTLRSNRLVSLLDTAPTLLDVAGQPIPSSYEGRSALDGPPRMAFFFADYSLKLAGARDGGNKFVYELDSGRSRLFDLARDAAEMRDVAAERPGLAREYAGRLRSWLAGLSLSDEQQRAAR